MTGGEADLLALAMERGLLRTSETAAREPELASLVEQGYLAVVPHDFGEGIVFFEVTEKARRFWKSGAKGNES